MQLEWLGKHRPLIEAIFLWSNRYGAIYKKPVLALEGVQLSFSEIQVIEYLLENEELQLNMAGVAKRLGISPVTFTDLCTKLAKMGLIEKTARVGSRKERLVVVTPKGRTVYDSYSKQLHAIWHKDVLALLDTIPEEHCQTLQEIFQHLADPTLHKDT